MEIDTNIVAKSRMLEMGAAAMEGNYTERLR